MKKNLLFPSLFFLLLFYITLWASDMRLQALAGLRYAVPDAEIKLNLLHLAGNVAWLNENDSLNWGRYSLNTRNEWGNLQRYWDAEGVHRNYFLFAGQKHLSPKQVFFGSVQFNYDQLYQVNRAIDPTPYASDPFVLADSTKGNFNYYGPKVFVAFSQRLFTKLYLGLSLNYGISHGLKTVYSRPEIIGRYIQGSIDLAYAFNFRFVLGLSFRPYDNQNITRLAKQPNGLSPVLMRYRGEFEYNKYITTGQRTARYQGYEISPQIAYKGKRTENVTLAGYRYLWQNIFDGTTTHTYDGFYQAQKYYFKTTWRFYSGSKRQNILTLHYTFKYLQDWAKEPVAGFMIYQAWYRTHKTCLGYSHHFKAWPVILGAELDMASYNPRKNDYLAHRMRHGKNSNWVGRFGAEFQRGPAWRFRMGYLFQKYLESSVWNYFGDFKGQAVTYGLGFYGTSYEIEGFLQYGKLLQVNQINVRSPVKREQFYLQIAIKHFF